MTINGALPKPKVSLPVESPSHSFWHTTLHELDDHRSTPELPEESDLVIIGAGYAGVATAYHLLNPEDGSPPSKESITLLEARGACSGATGRNGGHLRPDLYGHIPTYIQRAGLEAAAELAEFEIAHVGAIKRLVKKENIDCEFTLTRTVDVWMTDATAEKAKGVYEAMVSHGLKYMDDVDFTMGKSAEGISGVKGAKACSTYTAGTIWPYKFILALLAKLLDSGSVNLQTYTPVTEVTPHPNGGFTIQTNRGSMRAKRVIHATNAYVKALLPEYAASIVPCKGICCHITVPSGNTAPLVNNSYIIRTGQEDGNVLSYLIPRADGSIVVGGASQLFKPHRDQWYDNVDDSILIDSAKDYYDNYMQRIFRGWETSDAKVNKIWTGVMGYSSDSNPSVGDVPDKPGQTIIAGFNGHGMPVIWLAAKGLAEMINSGKTFEETGMPRLLKTTKERLERAMNGPEGGDILA